MRERRGGRVAAGGDAGGEGAADSQHFGRQGLQRPLGQGAAFDRMVRLARRRQLPHAVVVEGASGTGKSTVLRWLAAALLCPSELEADEPCAVCRACTRVANDLHPDMHVVRRAQDEAERKEWKTSFYVVKVDQVRAAEAVLQRHAIEGGARVAIFCDADHLEEPGQNALLKTLEEPGDQTFLLLEAARPEQLLPTVRSRVQRLKVLPLADAVVREQLGARFPGESERVEELVRLAHGSLGMALAASTERAVQLHDLVRTWLATNHGLRPVAAARAVLAGVPERRLEVEAARMFLWLMRAELRRQRDALAEVGQASYPPPAQEPWTSWLERTLQCERDLDMWIPPEQALIGCLLQMQ